MVFRSSVVLRVMPVPAR